MRHDLLLTGGTLIDPSQRLNGRQDVGFASGRVSAVAVHLAAGDAAAALDCTGMIVTPGWIDLHVHAFAGCSHYGIDPDPGCVARGVTTAVDAGSAGADTFEGFLRYVMRTSKTRLFAFLNISSTGMLSSEVGELEHLAYADPRKAAQTVENHRESILGIKVRLSRDLVLPSAGLEPLRIAREAARTAGVPVMVHPNDAWSGAIEPILEALRPGDILTHCFQGHECGILGQGGAVREAVKEAAERGVIFDVGHGMGSFRWEVAERAMSEGFFPRTISTDLHRYNVAGPVHDLATTMSKFLLLGMSLEDVVTRVTVNPAALLPAGASSLGSLALGSQGDAVVFRLEKGSFPFIDAHGGRREGTLRISPVYVIRNGALFRG